MAEVKEYVILKKSFGRSGKTIVPKDTFTKYPERFKGYIQVTGQEAEQALSRKYDEVVVDLGPVDKEENKKDSTPGKKKTTKKSEK